MIRRILCRDCVPRSRMVTKPDARDHYMPYVAERKVFIALWQPAVCDTCGKDVFPIGVAESFFRDGEERDWESEYGEVLTDDAVKLFDGLTK